MRIELDDENTKKAEQFAGQLGMSVNAYVNWLVAVVTNASVKEDATVEMKQPDGSRRVVRKRVAWITRF